MLEAIAIKYWAPIQFAFLLLFSWVMWSLQRKFATPEYVQAAIEKHRQESRKRDAELSELHIQLQAMVNEHHEGMIEVRATIAHMPTHKDLSSIHRRIDEMNSQLQTISGKFDQSSRTLQIIHDYLMNGGR